MKNFLCALCAVLLLFAVTFPAMAQNDAGLYATGAAPEKCFLHIDRSVFAPGETIWLRGYLMNSTGVTDTPLSNYLYVELLGDTVVSRILLKKDRLDGFSGHFPLPGNIREGKYILRAYTRWMSQWPAAYMFHTQIIVTKDFGGSYVYADKSGEEAPVAFYPEGGDCLSDSQIALVCKTLQPNTEARIYNERGEEVYAFQSDAHGLAWIRFEAEAGSRYVAKLTGQEPSYPLPPIKEYGSKLSVSRGAGGLLFVDAYVRPKASDDADFFLLVFDNSMIYCEMPMEKTAGHYASRVGFKTLEQASGVHCALLVNDKGEILSSRPFYIENEQDEIAVGVEIDKLSLVAEKQLRVDLRLTDNEGKPVEGRFSVSVVNEAITGYMQEDNLKSHFLLSSELAFRPRDLSSYFGESLSSSRRMQELDMLLLSSKWQYHMLPFLMNDDPLLQEKEQFQSLRGRAFTVLNNAPKNYTLTIFSPELGLFDTQAVRGSASFMLDSLNFPEGSSFVLQAKGPMRIPPMQLAIQPPVYSPHHAYASYYPAGAWQKRTSTTRQEVASRRQLDEPIIVEEGSTLLKTAVVSARRKVPLGLMVNPSRVRGREDLKVDDDIDVLTYIVSNYSGFREGESGLVSTRLGSGAMYSGAETAPPVYINGIETSNPELRHMYIRDVETLVVLRGTEALPYLSVHGAVFIYTRMGNWMKMEYNNPSLLHTTPLGWQWPEVFIPTPNAATLYWNPAEMTDAEGYIRIEFSRGDILRPLVLRIEGMTTDGRPISKLVTLK